MDIVDYPFIKTGGASSRPVLFIRIACPSTNRIQDTTALIDPGAGQCCVPPSFAKTLGFDLTSGDKRTVRTASGTADAYVHDCGLTVWNTHELLKGNKVAAHAVPTMPMYFVTGLTDVLLGVSFLNTYILTLDYDQKVFSLREP